MLRQTTPTRTLPPLADVTRLEVDELQEVGATPMPRAVVVYRSGLTATFQGQTALAMVEAVKEQRRSEQRWGLVR